MTLEGIITYAQIFLLIFARVYALLQTAPLLSSSAVPRIGRIGLAFFASVAVLPSLIGRGTFVIPERALDYAVLLVGEIFVGLVIGFILDVVFAAFQLAGQFFSLQMGFAASQVFDPMSQIEIPLMGQYLNLMAMFVLITSEGFRKTFLIGVYRSFTVVTAYDFAVRQDHLVSFIIGAVGGLFKEALIISLPILGTILLVSVSMGLLARAAPQMNLLMLGFPINITVAFIMIFLGLPFLMETFASIIDMGFQSVLGILEQTGGGV
ncbi:MAG: flagellar biosynthetic protein FliR [Spirochaetales bacterium]|nr:flagellar biosynthetic protein FliR [Spirochaetales bacterium]